MHGSSIKKLKTYFKNRDDVLMAFLFGSHAKGYNSKMSDWDIGVYLKPKSGSVEWETRKLYNQEGEIERDLSKLLNTDDIDLVVFNNAPANIADTAIRGLPLSVKDRGLFLDFMLGVSQEAEDWRQTVEEYTDVYWRSKSLASEDQDRLNRQLIFLDSELRDFEKFRQLTQKEYQDEEDKTKKREVERWIETLMMSIIDISKIILASEHRNVPSSYSDIIEKGCLFFGFSEEIAHKFAKWAKLRNIVAHEYLDLRWIRQIKPFIDEAEPHFKKFLNRAKDMIARKSNG